MGRRTRGKKKGAGPQGQNPFLRVPPWAVLEGYLQGELNDARSVGAHHLPETSASQRSIHSIEIGVVESVERLGAELDVPAFPDPEVLEESQVEVVHAGSADEPDS